MLRSLRAGRNPCSRPTEPRGRALLELARVFLKLDLLGATNLIPGPNSTEMAIHVGHLRAGWAGLVVAGASFIFPAFLIVLGCAWAYVRFGTLPAASGLLYGPGGREPQARGPGCPSWRWPPRPLAPPRCRSASSRSSSSS